MAGVAFTVYGIHWFAMARRYLGGKNLRRGLAVVNNLLEAWGELFYLKKVLSRSAHSNLTRLDAKDSSLQVIRFIFQQRCVSARPAA